MVVITYATKQRRQHRTSKKVSMHLAQRWYAEAVGCGAERSDFLNVCHRAPYEGKKILNMWKSFLRTWTFLSTFLDVNSSIQKKRVENINVLGLHFLFICRSLPLSVRPFICLHFSMCLNLSTSICNPTSSFSLSVLFPVASLVAWLLLNFMTWWPGQGLDKIERSRSPHK